VGFFFKQFVYICVIMAAKESTLRLHQDIRKEFDKLSSIKEYGVKKYSYEWMMAKIAHEFYKTPRTIENIVFNRVNLSTTPNNLFSQEYNQKN
jgi:hypothetical protein